MAKVHRANSRLDAISRNGDTGDDRDRLSVDERNERGREKKPKKKMCHHARVSKTARVET